MVDEKIEIGFEESNQTPKELRKELRNELNQMDYEEDSPNSKMAPSPIVVPDKVARGFIRAENAIILSILTKDCSSSVKQAAREAIEPNESDIAVVNDFIKEIVKRYAPRTFADPLVTAAVLYSGNLALKIGTVYGIKEGDK